MRTPRASGNGQDFGMGSATAVNFPGDICSRARFNMVESQLRTNRVTDSRLLEQLSEMPREIFVPAAMAPVAYVDESLKIAPGRYLIEPLLLARLLQEAAVEPEDKVLVVGAGTGYSAAILGNLAASVVALESDPALAAKARATLGQLGLIDVAVECGPLETGWPASAPYDLILIDGMIAALPDAISAQLAERGRLVAIKATEGRCGAGWLGRKLGGAVSGRILFDAIAPLLPGFSPQPQFQF
jgi:protein-L-isoaspartate(D-aspartate) O-methyltransferase